MNELEFLITLLEQDLVFEANTRDRQIKSINEKEKYIKPPRILTLDDNSIKSYYIALKTHLSPRQFRRKIRENEKERKSMYRQNKKNSYLLKKNFNKTIKFFGRTFPEADLIVLNPESKETTIDHEKEHLRQYSIAKQYGGVQNARRLHAKYLKDKALLEDDAESSGEGKCPDNITRKKNVRKTLGLKRKHKFWEE